MTLPILPVLVYNNAEIGKDGDDMYLPERKEAFLSTLTLSDSVLRIYRSIFDRIAEIEERCGHDFTELDLEQAQEAFDLVSGSTMSTARMAYTLLATYFKWCFAHDYPVTEAVLSINVNSGANFRHAYVCSPAQLLLTLDAVMPVTVASTMNCIYRAYLWMIFIGMSESEILNLRVEDVDTTLWRIHTQSGSEYTVYAEAIPDIYTCVSSTEMTFRRFNAIKTVKRTRGGLVLRLEDPQNAGTAAKYSTVISKRMNAIAESAEADTSHISSAITPVTVRQSGIFFRAYQNEQMGFEPDFEEYVMADFVSKERQKVQHEAGLIARVRRRYTQNYEQWKKAFAVVVHDKAPRHRKQKPRH